MEQINQSTPDRGGSYLVQGDGSLERIEFTEEAPHPSDAQGNDGAPVEGAAGQVDQVVAPKNKSQRKE